MLKREGCLGAESGFTEMVNNPGLMLFCYLPAKPSQRLAPNHFYKRKLQILFRENLSELWHRSVFILGKSNEQKAVDFYNCPD